MLTVLCLTAPRRRRMRLRRLPSVNTEAVPAGSGRYTKIVAHTNRDGHPDWAEIRRAAGKEAGHMVLPRGISPPPDSRIVPFQGVELSRRLMELAAVELLKMVSLHPRLVRISVYDPQAIFPELPLMFFPYAADVRAVTGRPERFAPVKYAAMEQFGAVLTVTEDITALNGSLLLIVPGGRLPAAAARGWTMTASPAHSFLQKKERKGIIDGYFPRIPRSLSSVVPRGCDAMQFFAGLYERSGVREIAARPPEFLQTGGHTITLKDAAWRLAGLDIGAPV